MTVDWSQLYLRYAGKWVALADDERTVVGVGSSATEATLAAQAKGHQTPILARMPKNLHAFIG